MRGWILKHSLVGIRQNNNVEDMTTPSTKFPFEICKKLTKYHKNASSRSCSHFLNIHKQAIHRKWDYTDLIIYFQVRNTKKKLSARCLSKTVKNLVTKTLHELSKIIQKIAVTKERKCIKKKKTKYLWYLLYDAKYIFHCQWNNSRWFLLTLWYN